MKVLITGGSRGLGRFVALEFFNQGYDVIVNYNESHEAALSLKKELGDKCTIIKADISNENEVKKMFDSIDSLDVLVNNAAISLDKDPLEKSASEFNKVLSVNLTGTFLVTKYAIDKMEEGSIINISSTNAIDTYYPESIDYDASKAGIISLTHNFSKYLNDIRVNCICPDWIDTDMNKDMDEFYKRNIRFINPEELAKIVYRVSVNKKLNDQIIKVGDNSVK